MSCQIMADEVVNSLQKDPGLSFDLNERADRARRQMKWDLALDLCRQSLALCSGASIDVEYYRAITQMYKGALYHSMGDLEEAENWYRRSANIFSINEDVNSQWNEAVAQYALGLLAQSAGDWYQAQTLYYQSFRQFERLAEEGVDVRSPVHLVRERMQHLDFLRRRRQKAQEQADSVPIIGTTAAGEPILAIEVGPEDVFLDRISLGDRNGKVKKILGAGKGTTLELRSGSTYFALRVKGDSMTWVDIHNGDYVIFRQQPDADPGDIVVVRIDYAHDCSSTVKRLDRQGKAIVLKAENPAHEPPVLIFGPGDPTIEILGRALAVVSC